jgi:hypothetical protein
MHSAGFEPTIPESQRPQTNALNSAATGIGSLDIIRFTKSRRIDGLGMWNAWEVRCMYAGFWCENVEEKTSSGNHGIDWRVVLK